MANLVFNAADVQHNDAAIPEGVYQAQIVQSEMRPTKAGTGSYLWLNLEILDGRHQGRHVFDMLNLENPNQTAVEIAQRKLASICAAVGKPAIEDSEELHLHPLRVKLTIEESADFGDRNKVAKYFAPDRASAAVATAPKPVTSGQPAAMPWQGARAV